MQVQEGSQYGAIHSSAAVVLADRGRDATVQRISISKPFLHIDSNPTTQVCKTVLVVWYRSYGAQNSVYFSQVDIFTRLGLRTQMSRHECNCPCKQISCNIDAYWVKIFFRLRSMRSQNSALWAYINRLLLSAILYGVHDFKRLTIVFMMMMIPDRQIHLKVFVLQLILLYRLHLLTSASSLEPERWIIQQGDTWEKARRTLHSFMQSLKGRSATTPGYKHPETHQT